MVSLERRVFTSKVARRTFVLFVGCSLLPVFGLAALAFSQVTSQLQAESQRRLQQTSKVVAIVLFNRLRDAETALTTVAGRMDEPAVAEARREFQALLLTDGAGTTRALFGTVAPPRRSPPQSTPA